MSYGGRGKNTYVFVLCRCGKQLMPTTAPKARILLKRSKARVFRLYPFTIQLNYKTPHHTQPVEIRIDYGAKTHGIALAQQCKTHDRAVFLGEAEQRQDVKKKIDVRRELRKARRRRNTRYRKRRFSNRKRQKGWIPPTIAQRAESTTRITKTLAKMIPITSAVTEIGMLDTQKMTNPKIQGVEFQRGPGYEFENKRQAILAYFRYQCQYCGTRQGMMTVDHVIPKSRGGTDAWGNLTCACKACNDKKGDGTPEEAGMPHPATAKPGEPKFLKFCAIEQSGKNRLVEQLQKLVPTQTVHGWQTKQNREVAKLPKTHCSDALCTRNITDRPITLTRVIHEIRLRRRNTRQTHFASPKKGGKRQPYNPNKRLEEYRKGDLVQTPHGLAYITALTSAERLKYRTIRGQESTVKPNKAKLVESTRAVQFFTR